MTSKKQMNFEESLKKLEKIVAEMENADPDLDKSLSLFNQGIELVEFCSEKLNETKKKIEILIKDAETIKKENFIEQ
ncbi:MAG: exodeoxyribonuclease VII small subunit [Elusimicrobiota bacterium]|jgi:exodeoxyribonuclease VII small subunit|nr:exodeoxyribonuclease VII small subunit [Elusimicrobiota bacterium]